MVPDVRGIPRRGFLKATGGIATATTFGGVATGDGDAGNHGEKSSRSRPLRAFNSGPRTLDPVRGLRDPSREVTQQLFDGLFTFRDGEEGARPNLVDGYTTDDTFTSYTFTLKQGVPFHDGREVTAADVEFSFERVADSPHAHRHVRHILFELLRVTHERDDDGNYVPWSLGVEATGRYEVSLELERPFHDAFDVLAYSAFAVVPEGIVGDVEGYDGEMSTEEFATSNPVGSGPFEFGNWREGDGLFVRRFEKYHGDTADVAAVRWRIRTDDDARYREVLDRKVDVFDIPTSHYDPEKVTVETTDSKGRQRGTYGPLANDAVLNYSKVPTGTTFYVGFNTDVVPAAARSAFAYALDQHETARDVYQDRVTPAYLLTPPLLYPGEGRAYADKAEQAYPYGYASAELDAARGAMEEAGYGDDNRLTFGFTHYHSAAWSTFAETMKNRLADVYIDLEVEAVGFNQLLRRGRHGRLDSYVLGWVVDWPEADNVLQLIYPPNTDTSTERPLTYTNWDGTEAAERAAAAYETVLDNYEPTDAAERTRNEAYVTIEEANWDDLVVLPVHHREEERFWYDGVDVPIHGTMGSSRQKYNRVGIDPGSNGRQNG